MKTAILVLIVVGWTYVGFRVGLSTGLNAGYRAGVDVGVAAGDCRIPETITQQFRL